MSTEAGVPEYDNAEVLARISRSWDALNETMNGLAEADVVAPGPAGGWSVKDHLAHVTAWEQSLLALLEGRDRNAALGLDPAVVGEDEEIDAINASIARRGRECSLAQVRDALRRSHHDLMTVLAGLSDADLSRPYADYQPDDPAANAEPVIGWIVGNTFAHYDDHAAAIRALIAARQR